jgi:hypothetical protein
MLKTTSGLTPPQREKREELLKSGINFNRGYNFKIVSRYQITRFLLENTSSFSLFERVYHLAHKNWDKIFSKSNKYPNKNLSREYLITHNKKYAKFKIVYNCCPNILILYKHRDDLDDGDFEENIFLCWESWDSPPEALEKILSEEQ